MRAAASAGAAACWSLLKYAKTSASGAKQADTRLSQVRSAWGP